MAKCVVHYPHAEVDWHSSSPTPDPHTLSYTALTTLQRIHLLLLLLLVVVFETGYLYTALAILELTL